MALGSFSSLFIALCMFVFRCCRLPYYLWVPSSLHSLGIHLPRLSDINSFQEKEHWCSRTCYCSKFANEHYQIPFYFHLNQLRNFPAKTYRSVKKRIALAQRLGGQYAFSVPLSDQSTCVMTWKQAQSYNIYIYSKNKDKLWKSLYQSLYEVTKVCLCFYYSALLRYRALYLYEFELYTIYIYIYIYIYILMLYAPEIRRSYSTWSRN